VPKPKGTSGRPKGAVDKRRRTNSPAVNLWEAEHGPDVPQSGPTVFHSEAVEAFREILTMLKCASSWDEPEPFNLRDQCSAVAMLPEGDDTAPWHHVTGKWIFDWLNTAGVGGNAFSFNRFAVVVAMRVIRLHPLHQLQLEDFARCVLRLGSWTVRATVESCPQGFTLAPKTFEKQLIYGKEALAAIPKMKDPPEQPKDRLALLTTLQRLRREEFVRLQKAGGHVPENKVEISFKKLIEAHTGKRIKSLPGPRLEGLRRSAREIAKAGEFLIDFKRPVDG
jgi:hypothetical protein